jgi:hypothetical protein
MKNKNFETIGGPLENTDLILKNLKKSSFWWNCPINSEIIVHKKEQTMIQIPLGKACAVTSSDRLFFI